MTPETLGTYRLTSRIGRGGMAEVLAAEGPDGARVVVKRMLPHLAAEHEYVKLFLREARIAARLRHPNVVRLLDADREGETLYLVFERVDGMTLHELARRAWHAERALPIELCVRAIADAAIGLHHAHELKDDGGALAGLVHRDVSPDNLMIDTHGVTRVLDFGIAKSAGDAASRVSKTGELRGKLAFMSPEQAEGRPLDRRSDLFSLGTTLFWLLTAQKPFAGRTDILTLKALLEHDAPAPSTVNPRVPKALDPIVARLLAKDPAQRYATAKELHRDLERTLPRDDQRLRATCGAFVADITAMRDDTNAGTVVVEMPVPTIPSASVMLVDTHKDEEPVRSSTNPIALVALGFVALVALAAGAAAFMHARATTPIEDAGVRAQIVAHVDAGVAIAELRRAAVVVDAGVVADAGDEIDDVPLESLDKSGAHVATKRVQLVAPAGITWKARAHKDVAEVSPGAKSIVAVDVYGGVHDVPISDGKADYGALAKGTVQIWLPPAGGEVFLGSKSLGQAPLKPVELVVGKYKVRAKMADKSEEQVLVVVPGKNLVRFK